MANASRWIEFEGHSHDWSLSPSFQPPAVQHWKSFVRFLVDSKAAKTPSARAVKQDLSNLCSAITVATRWVMPDDMKKDIRAVGTGSNTRGDDCADDDSSSAKSSVEKEKSRLPPALSLLSRPTTYVMYRAYSGQMLMDHTYGQRSWSSVTGPIRSGRPSAGLCIFQRIPTGKSKYDLDQTSQRLH